MSAAEIEPKSPLIPLFSKGEFPRLLVEPLFGKEGKGRFWSNAAGLLNESPIHNTPVPKLQVIC
jgi:hypothetical protein